MGRSLRIPVKSVAEAALTGSGAAALSRRRRRRRGDVVILAFHNVVPRGESAVGDRSLHMPQTQFSELLDQLLETHQVVSLEELRSLAAPASRPHAVITFDDAYRGAMSAGVEELVKRGLPATVFVAPGCLGKPSFWWDAVRTPRGEGPPEPFRQEALTVCRGLDGPVRDRAREVGLSLEKVPEHQQPVTEGELRAVAKHPGTTFGSHSWSHPNLARLSGRKLDLELVQPLEWLADRFQPLCRWLAYPYGLRSQLVEREAAVAGYVGAVRIEGGLLRGGLTEPFAVPRVNIPAGVSRRGFALRCAGWFCE